jgi:hypothetical protein
MNANPITETTGTGRGGTKVRTTENSSNPSRRGGVRMMICIIHIKAGIGRLAIIVE